MACALCGGDRAGRVLLTARDPDGISQRDWRLAECPECGLRAVVPPPPEEDLARHYPRAYYRDPQAALAGPVAAAARLWHRLRFRRAAGRRLPGRVLDVGCGDAGVLKSFHAAGWNACGVETSAAGAALGAARGIAVLGKPLAECGFPAGHFDLVMFWHSLEHTRDPVGTLREAARLLKPGGLALIAVPNAGSWEAALFGPHWFHLDLPRHLFHFTPRTLDVLLGRAGLEVVRIRWHSPGYNVYGAWQSLLNALPGETNALYKTLKGIPARRPAARRLALAVSAATAPFLLPLAALFALAAAVCRRSGCIEVWARRPAPAR